MKTFLKAILCLFLVLSIFSCKEASDRKPNAVASDRKPNAVGTSYATLIAYSIHGKHKRSDATFQLNKIGSIHIVDLPRRTQPIMALGDSIKVNYKVYGNEIELSDVNIETKPYTSKGYFSLNN
jgi:hypothetical protein